MNPQIELDVNNHGCNLKNLNSFFLLGKITWDI